MKTEKYNDITSESPFCGFIFILKFDIKTNYISKYINQTVNNVIMSTSYIMS